jgi:hypothetical protein
MKGIRDKINEENRRAAKAGKAGGLPTTLPSVPTPRENDNKDYVHKFKLARYPGGDPASFDEDTHH